MTAIEEMKAAVASMIQQLDLDPIPPSIPDHVSLPQSSVVKDMSRNLRSILQVPGLDLTKELAKLRQQEKLELEAKDVIRILSPRLLAASSQGLSQFSISTSDLLIPIVDPYQLAWKIAEICLLGELELENQKGIKVGITIQDQDKIWGHQILTFTW